MFKSIIPLLLVLSSALSACAAPPEITASSRKEAMQKCFAGIDRSMAEMRSDPVINLFASDEFGTVTILQKYCKPMKYKNHDGYWRVYGYVEYLTEPTAKYPGKSEVQDVIVYYGETWKQS